MQDTGLNKVTLLALFLLLSIFAGVWLTTISDNSSLIKNISGKNERVIVVNGVRLAVEVADSEEEWAKGLSGREYLPPLRGMLFVFPKEDYYQIWMREMKFPIDIFWIRSDGVIIDIKKHATPDSYPEVYTPRSPAKYVLETVADFADEYNIEIGDKVYKLPK